MVASALALLLAPHPAAPDALAIVLRSRDPVVDAERRFLARRWRQAIELPMTESTAAEAWYVAASGLGRNPRGMVLVTSLSHAYRAVATFAKAMPGTRFYVATTRPPPWDVFDQEFQVEADKCRMYAEAGDVMDDAELMAYLAWRDAYLARRDK